MKAPIQLLAIALLAIPAPAAADTCKVRVVRAPDEVRPVIEAWVRAEPNCTEDLEVRVVPTEGGYYLHARDTAGRVRERTVPDAQSVGVLIASWIADDAMPVAPPIKIAPPHTAPQMERTEPTVSPVRPAGLSFALGAITSLAKGYGLRAEVELTSRGGWLAYGAASLGRTGFVYATGESQLELFANDARLALGVGHAWSGPRWGVRARVGLQRANWTGDFGDVMLENTTFVSLETGMRISRRINDRWSFVGGLDVSKPVASGRLGFIPAGSDTIWLDPPGLEIGALAGFDVRL